MSYSYKFAIEDERGDAYGLREADFVVVHPNLGFIVVEVKQGNVRYHGGVWQSEVNGSFEILSKDPLDQARKAMFAIIQRYRQVSQQQDYPLQFRYALCFPESTQTKGILPEDLHEGTCWTGPDLDNIEECIIRTFKPMDTHAAYEINKILITKVLAPTFQVFSTAGDQLDQFHQQAALILTEEQERILEETEEDSRKIFFGAAGTGKTFIAIKKALNLEEQGHKVLLTCYNENLVKVLRKGCPHEQVVIDNFHGYIRQVLLDTVGQVPPIPSGRKELQEYFEFTLPEVVLDLYADIPVEKKYDAIIVDEGQDFREFWFLCLEEMLKLDGHFYIFADQHQNLFGNGLDALKGFQISKHKLTINLRNSEKINEWTRPYLPGTKLRYRLRGGPKVQYFPWKDEQHEKRLLEKEINKLISQKVLPQKITILSPNRLEKSSLKDTKQLLSWPIEDVKQYAGQGIQFSTIRAYKGLESDVILLIGVKNDTLVCTPADLYVGGTRARFMLYIFHHEDWEPSPVSRTSIC